MVPISDALPKEAWDHIRFQASIGRVEGGTPST